MLERYGLRTYILAVLAILLAATDTGLAGQSSKEDRAIRAVLERQVQAWNARDLEGFMQGYWNSPNLSFYSGGTKTSGWQPTLERYRKNYQSEGKEMGRLDFTELQVEMLGPRAAFVRGRFHLKMNAGDQTGIFTLVFRKFADGWKIIHDHTGAS